MRRGLGETVRVSIVKGAFALAILSVALTGKAQSSIELRSISLSPSIVFGGASSTGTATLTKVAPSGGTTVTLASDNAAATVPASVSIPAGASSATFTVTTSAVGANTFGNYHSLGDIGCHYSE